MGSSYLTLSLRVADVGVLEELGSPDFLHKSSGIYQHSTLPDKTSIFS